MISSRNIFCIYLFNQLFYVIINVRCFNFLLEYVHIIKSNLIKFNLFKHFIVFLESQCIIRVNEKKTFSYQDEIYCKKNAQLSERHSCSSVKLLARGQGERNSSLAVLRNILFYNCIQIKKSKLRLSVSSRRKNDVSRELVTCRLNH